MGCCWWRVKGDFWGMYVVDTWHDNFDSNRNDDDDDDKVKSAMMMCR
jgi:hypothetical protein